MGLLLFDVLSFLLCLSLVDARLPGGVRNSTADRYTVCGAPGEPWVRCELNTTSDDPDAKFSGYSPTLFRHAAALVGWEESRDYVFLCMDWVPMLADIAAPDGICDATSSGMPYDQKAIAAGVQYTYPDGRQQVTIMVYAESSIGGHWLFLQPLTWQVWMMLLIAALVVGVCIHLVEVLSKQHTERQIEFEPYLLFGEHGWMDSVWQGLGLVVNAVDPFSAVTVMSRLIVFVWCFVILLVLTMYTGNAAAILTANAWDSPVKSRDDLRGVHWGCVADTANILTNIGLIPDVIFPWDNDQDQATFLEALQNGSVTALLMDGALAYSVAKDDCNYHMVPGGLDNGVNIAISFAANIPPGVITRFDAALLQMNYAGDLDQLHTNFLNPPSTCGGAPSAVNAVQFNQLSGLWVVLGATIAFSVAIAAVTNIVNRYKMVHRIRRATPRFAFSAKKRDAAAAAVAAKAAKLELHVTPCGAECAGKEIGANVVEIECPLYVDESVYAQIASLEEILGALKATVTQRKRFAHPGEV